jgi:hypothetical protein
MSDLPCIIEITNKGQQMVNYFPLSDEIEGFAGEIVFQSDEYAHILIDGTDAIAVVPTVDVYPA